MTNSGHRRFRVRPVPVAMMLLLMLGAPVVEAQTIPTPRDKPGVTDEDPADSPGGSDEDPTADKPGAADDDPMAPLDEIIPVAPPSFCLKELEDAGAVLGNSDSFVSSGECTVTEPVVIEAISTRVGRIELPARPVLDCRFATVLAAWTQEVVSPVAASLLGSPLDALVTGPGYQCRSRAGGKLSEHATGNAIDVTHFQLEDGRSITIEALPRVEGAEREFLRAISASACGYFTTVLGPGSDVAHSDHLHIDLAERRTTGFRICMAR